jgi:CHAT domain-containing protein/tetratricopeptide (TPR) repeat protein
MKLIPILLFSLFTFHSSLSQDITTDTILANEYFQLADEYTNNDVLDSALLFLQKAEILYVKHLGERSLKVAEILDSYGIIQYYVSDFDESLNAFNKSLEIRKEILGENHPVTARCYLALGIIHDEKSHYNESLNCYSKALNIYIDQFGEKNLQVASCFNNIGLVYWSKNDYDKALEYLFKALRIRKELLGENDIEIAGSYCNIGLVYWKKGQYDLALEYHFKDLYISKAILGENHTDVAKCYTNIGIVYNHKYQPELTLDFYKKALSIYTKEYNEQSYLAALINNNIGIVYGDLGKYETALVYYYKSLDICNSIYDYEESLTAQVCCNIGNALLKQNKLDSALIFSQKALQMFTSIFGEMNASVAMVNNNLGHIFKGKGDLQTALKYYHKGALSCIRNGQNNKKPLSVPNTDAYFEWIELLIALQSKAETLNMLAENVCADSSLYYKQLALEHFHECDRLISNVRRETTTLSDKITLGESAYEIYKGAIHICTDFPSALTISKNFKENAFYFCERNKSSVLLEALAGSEALEFAGLPKQLLEKETDLRNDIVNVSNLKNNAESDSIYTIYGNELFSLNRSYDSLIRVFESDFPEYYKLKYNNAPVSIKDMQALLNARTALLSYFIADSSITIFLLTKNRFNIHNVPKINDFDLKLQEIRLSMQNSNDADVLKYKTLAFELYKQLFPNELTKNKSFAKIENLIIIPDGNLASLPFESLLTEEYTANWTDWKNTAYFSDMPFLIKKYAISYSYSATLFQNTFPKQRTEKIEFTGLNDWLAFAPVFDNNGTAGTNAVTRELLSEINHNNFNGSDKTRSFLRDGTYISPLPGSLDEVNEIFELYDQNVKKAKIYTHKKADESILKSDELLNYRILHFATHGFVNTENPELSGILTAQDTSASFTDNEDIYGNIAQQNDGIWYQSEIYNTKFNADLVVLSACETGLGKIASGEGVIGLTRALLYAGTKNIIVSLWQVSDESTKQLMVGFYKNLLAKRSGSAYAEHLRKAKLQLIKEGTYAHPFFWSPFILIGK